MPSPRNTTPAAGRHRAQPAATKLQGRGGVRAGRRGKNNTKGLTALPTILLIIGMLIMLYPVASTLWNNHNSAKVAEQYAQMDRNTPQVVKDQQWEDAHKYNQERATGPILDPWLNELTTTNNPDYARYLHTLDSNDAMARLFIPSIKTDLPVYHGTDEHTLQKGLGHLYGSDLPVGGESTHSIITGHTGLPNNTMFDRLKDMHEGDAIYIHVTGHKLKYVVDQIKVVLPHEIDSLQEVQGQDLLTLVTCTPYGINSHRLLVRGHAEPLTPADEALFDESHNSMMRWWMWVLIAAVVAVALSALWWHRRQSSSPDAAQAQGDGEPAGEDAQGAAGAGVGAGAGAVQAGGAGAGAANQQVFTNNEATDQEAND